MKVILNIEKRYAYAIIGLLIILVGVVAVAAYNPSGSGGDPTVMGHDASEVGAGSFNGDQYDFLHIVGIGTYRATNPLPGILWLRGGQADNLNLVTIINDGSGNLKFSTNGVYPLVVRKTGNIEIKSGSSLCLGTDCKSAWPTTSGTQCVLCRGTNNYQCGGLWTKFTGSIDGGTNGQVTLDLNCVSYPQPDSTASLTDGQTTFYLKQHSDRANLCCR